MDVEGGCGLRLQEEVVDEAEDDKCRDYGWSSVWKQREGNSGDGEEPEVHADVDENLE